MSMIRREYTTGSRRLVAEALRGERRYLSAAELHALLKAERKRVALSTVYRALERLREVGEVTVRLDERGEARYLSCERSHHHHAICRGCGQVEDVPCEAIDRFAQALWEGAGFRLDDHAMEFFGLCRRCVHGSGSSAPRSTSQRSASRR